MLQPSEEGHLFVRLYLDEDVFKDAAQALRLRGFDAVSVHELSRQGLADSAHLDYAADHGRAVFTFNMSDNLGLHVEYLSSGRWHAGIIVSRQLPIGEVVRRLLRLLSTVTAEEMRNQFWYLGT
jgi:hypothetical protein